MSIAIAGQPAGWSCCQLTSLSSQSMNERTVGWTLTVVGVDAAVDIILSPLLR